MTIDHEKLLTVSKPGRYTGGEVNAVYKEVTDSTLRFAFCFPDVYEIGMSNLGLQIMYYFLNEREDTFCERVFMPWPDMLSLMEDEGIPLFALESRDCLGKFDFLGFSLQVELSYTNVLAMLKLAGIPLRREERGEEHPLICAGGTCAVNPEPMADFFDFFVIGDGEASIYGILDMYKLHRGNRAEFLFAICGIDGVYVPQFFTPAYNQNGTLRSFGALSRFFCNTSDSKDFYSGKSQEEPSPTYVRRAISGKLDYYPPKLMAPLVEATQNRTVIEIARGCTRGCRFCQAGFVSRPMRERGFNKIVSLCDKLLLSTGHSEISLLSLSSCDYSRFGELIDRMHELTSKLKVNISLPSTRIDAISSLKKIKSVRTSTLTIAPEAGSQRMRDVINKNLSEAEILCGVFRAFEKGYDKIKLYFMSGLPLEEKKDTEEIICLCSKIVDEYYRLPLENRKRPVSVSVSTACFIPKPFTPFQWARQEKPEDFETAQKELKSKVKNKRVTYRYHDPYVAQVEGVLARGDRRIGRVIELAYGNGAYFDGWSEHFSYGAWIRAFEEAGLDPDFYTHREREEDEIFPWYFIDMGVTKEFLLSEWKKAITGELTPGCLDGCAGCGCCCK